MTGYLGWLEIAWTYAAQWLAQTEFKVKVRQKAPCLQFQ
jgi:hypothetical protein